MGSSVFATLNKVVPAGSFVYLELYNEWVESPDGCTEVAGADQVFTSTPVKVEMTLQSHGNYTGVFSVPAPGKFTIVVKEFSQSGNVEVETYDNLNFESSIAQANQTIQFNQITQTSIDNDALCSDDCSYKYKFKLVPTSTGDQTITFKALADGVYFIDDEFIGISFSESPVVKTINLDSTELYSFEIHLFDRSGPSNVSIDVTGNTYSASSNPLPASTHEAGCLPGYSARQSGSTLSCEINWGDGLKEESESCDDGNTEDGDGCSSLCIIEPWFRCHGGNVQPRRMWRLKKWRKKP